MTPNRPLFACALLLTLAACSKKPATSETGTTNASVAAQAAATAPAAAAPAAPKVPDVAFPAAPLAGKNLASFTIAAPPGSKMDSMFPDECTIKGSSYTLEVKTAKSASPDGLKQLLARMKTFKGFTVEQPDGFVAELEEPSGKQFQVVRYVDAGGSKLGCEATLKDPPRTKEAGAEAFAVCGTLKKK
jgi:hypothetical protein